MAYARTTMALVLLLAGCTAPLHGTWSRSGATPSQVAADWNACGGDELKGPSGVVVPLVAVPLVTGILYGIQHAKAQRVRACLEGKGYVFRNAAAAPPAPCPSGSTLARAANGEPFCWPER